MIQVLHFGIILIKIITTGSIATEFMSSKITIISIDLINDENIYLKHLFEMNIVHQREQKSLDVTYTKMKNSILQLKINFFIKSV